jgi:Kae1-associated kinase Bud32
MESLIAQGAEAQIIKSNSTVIKRRTKKSYRLPVLDEKIRKQRTKREAKLLEKASKLIPIPKMISTSLDKKEIKLEYINGKKLSEHLDTNPNRIQICETIGSNIAKLHDSDIIHGDLTTSNMILSKNHDNRGMINLEKEKLYFIDFGLSFTSHRIEDKAVDIHLIKQALEAKHFESHKKFFNAVLKGYRQSQNSERVIKQLEKVESRGRYKQQF